MDQKLLTQLLGCIRESAEGKFSPAEIDGLTGLSGRKLMHCLQRFSGLLCNEDAVYVELGVFQGLTLISNALINPKIECFGIDNFSLFNEGKKNLSIVEGRFAKYSVGNARIINLDYEEALLNLSRYLGNRKIGVFFVDGPHDYRSQLLPLLLSKPYLAESCAIVVDDSNYAHVRQANCDFLRSHPEFALLFEAYTPAHVANLKPEDKEDVIAGWWNGVNIIVRDSLHLLPREFPVEDAKHLYVESHEVFRHEFAELAFPALVAAQALLDASPEEAENAKAKLKAAMLEHRRNHPERFKNQNTYSRHLPASKIHA
jgi:hypothetical protein